LKERVDYRRNIKKSFPDEVKKPKEPLNKKKKSENRERLKYFLKKLITYFRT